MQKDIIRQGDLLFIPVDKGRNKHYKKDSLYYGYRKDGVIQEGEATGHNHKLENPEGADVFRPTIGGVAVVKVGDTPVNVIHEEHDTVTLDSNTDYAVHIARESDPTRHEGYRQVVD